MNDFLKILLIHFPVRWLMGLALCLALWNPWGYSVVGLASYGTGLKDDWPVKAIAAVAALGALALFARTSLMAMGWFGLAVVTGLVGLVGYLPFFFGKIPYTPEAALYVAYYFGLSAVIGCGLSAGYVKRWLAGIPLVQSTGHHGHTDAGHHG